MGRFLLLGRWCVSLTLVQERSCASSIVTCVLPSRCNLQRSCSRARRNLATMRERLTQQQDDEPCNLSQQRTAAAERHKVLCQSSRQTARCCEHNTVLRSLHEPDNATTRKTTERNLTRACATFAAAESARCLRSLPRNRQRHHEEKQHSGNLTMRCQTGVCRRRSRRNFLGVQTAYHQNLHTTLLVDWPDVFQTRPASQGERVLINQLWKSLGEHCWRAAFCETKVEPRRTRRAQPRENKLVVIPTTGTAPNDTVTQGLSNSENKPSSVKAQKKSLFANEFRP